MRVRTASPFQPNDSGNHISFDQFSRSHNFIDHFISLFMCAQIDWIRLARFAVWYFRIYIYVCLLKCFVLFGGYWCFVCDLYAFCENHFSRSSCSVRHSRADWRLNASLKYAVAYIQWKSNLVLWPRIKFLVLWLLWMWLLNLIDPIKIYRYSHVFSICAATMKYGAIHLCAHSSGNVVIKF